MEDWIYYKIQHKKNCEIELVCCIDLNTINDNVDCEWLQNNGTWDNHIPTYCSIENEDYTDLLNELKEINTYETNIIHKMLIDAEKDKLYMHYFENAILYVSYDEDKIVKN